MEQVAHKGFDQCYLQHQHHTPPVPLAPEYIAHYHCGVKCKFAVTTMLDWRPESNKGPQCYRPHLSRFRPRTSTALSHSQTRTRHRRSWRVGHPARRQSDFSGHWVGSYSQQVPAASSRLQLTTRKFKTSLLISTELFSVFHVVISRWLFPQMPFCMELGNCQRWVLPMLKLMEKCGQLCWLKTVL